MAFLFWLLNRITQLSFNALISATIMRKKNSFQFLFMFFPFLVFSQNLVPNGGFENFRGCPKHMGEFIVKDWFRVVNNCTPDLYSNCSEQITTVHPGYPYVSLQLREGNSFTGLILIDKKTDYREAIGVTLKENLKKDSVYIFEVSLAYPVLSRFSGGNLDIILSEKRIYVQNRTKKVNLPASISIPIDTVPTDGTWSTFHVEYKAKGYERFLSIGNFKPKKKTIYTQIEGRKKGIYRRFYNELYIAVDDVRLFPKYPLKTPQIADLDVPLPVKKETLVIKGIRFRTASAEIENTEIPDLDRLVEVMNENSRIRIRITGHTDNVGDSFLNQELSLIRAKSVQEYLRAKGIDEARVQVAGKGDTQPVASNETESGRTQNRRIEVEIIEQ